MKRVYTILLCVVLALFCVTPAFAAENYDETLTRLVDEIDWLTDDEESQVAAAIQDCLDRYGVDCPVFLLSKRPEGYDTVSAYNDAVYSTYNYGYGDSRLCVMLTLDLDASLLSVDSYRGAGTAFDVEKNDELAGELVENINAGEMPFGEVLATYVYHAAEAAAAGESTSGGRTAAMPEWYPEPDKVSNFADYHNDASTPRVVDDAGIFTDAQEAEMAARIAEIQQTYNYDFVVYTDNSDYGLGRGVCAADFYQFGGYGYGDDYSGGILYICMEPGNRGWWTAARGSYRNLFTEENCNAIDDRLEPYMVDGDYGTGVLNYLDDTAELMRTGKVPRTIHYGLSIAAAVVTFLLGGGVTTGILRSNMKTVRHATEAYNYLEKNSFHLRRSNDFFLHRSVTRTLRPKEEKSGGGGGHSSYSGGYHSSGGGSFSGGGRSF